MSSKAALHSAIGDVQARARMAAQKERDEGDAGKIQALEERVGYLEEGFEILQSAVLGDAVSSGQTEEQVIHASGGKQGG